MLVFPPDNRFEANQVQAANYQQAIHATAGMVYEKLLRYDSVSKMFSLVGPSFEERTGACPTHPYAQQPAPILCTGFLIGPRTLVTAGHCMSQSWDCNNNFWVFDYAYHDGKGAQLQLSYSQIYRCNRVISSEQDSDQKIDYAVIELDRDVSGRTPLRLGNGWPQISDKVFMPGHGGGLPMKVTAEGTVIGNSHPSFFQASLDALGGNSGSPVIDLKTGLVQGLLVRGGNAPEWKVQEQVSKASQSSCREEYVCDDSCSGVEITRSSLIQY